MTLLYLPQLLRQLPRLLEMLPHSIEPLSPKGGVGDVDAHVGKQVLWGLARSGREELFDEFDVAPILTDHSLHGFGDKEAAGV